MGRRILLWLGLTGLAMAIAGVYGALHDQISFSVSREYFTRFKFIQFGLIDGPWPERLRG